MQTTPQPVNVTARQGRLTAGIFTAGPFNGQRAITLDNGVFLPAGQAEGAEAAKGAFQKIFDETLGDIFGAGREAGAAEGGAA